MRKKLFSMFAVASLALVACGSDSAEEASTEETDQITIGLMPILDVVPVYLGINEGFFEEEGIELEIQNASGGAALVPAVVSGDFDFAFSNVTSLVIAKGQGLPIEVVSAGASSTGNPDEDFGSIMAASDSDIDSVEDLAGKRVAINTLNNINDSLIRDAMERAGGDPASIEFVEIAHPDMPAALSTGQVEAIWEVEPFLTLSQEEGHQPFYSLYAEAAEKLTVAAYFTSEKLAEENPDLVERFDRALRKSFEFASENPEEARDVVTSYTEIDSAILPDLTLPEWPTEIDRESVQLQIDLAERYGLIEESIDIESFMP